MVFWRLGICCCNNTQLNINSQSDIGNEKLNIVQPSGPMAISKIKYHIKSVTIILGR